MYDIKDYFNTNKIVKINYNKGLNIIKRMEAIKKLKRHK
mgnify:CR=1 FL=1